MEYLFKLKKDGKTVGYSKWTEDWGWEYSLTPDFEKPFHHFAVAQTKGITAHPFVTKDKNGKDVFADDEIKMFSKQYKIVWDERELGWFLQEEYKAKIKLSHTNKNRIELIKDKEND